MSRLDDRIKMAQETIALRQAELDDAQDVLDHLRSKEKQYHQKRLRKAWRKKYRNDPTYRLMHRMVGDMYDTHPANPEYKGISAQIEESK